MKERHYDRLPSIHLSLLSFELYCYLLLVHLTSALSFSRIFLSVLYLSTCETLSAVASVKYFSANTLSDTHSDALKVLRP